MNGFAENYLEINDGCTVRYLKKGSGPYILFISGWLGTAENFIPLMSVLCEKYTCISLDLPGFGQSTEFKSLPHTMENYETAVLTFLDKLGIDRTYYIGASLGASLGILLLSRNDQTRIRKAILQSPVYKQIPKWDNESRLGLWFVYNANFLMKILIRITKYDLIKKLAYNPTDKNIQSLTKEQFFKYCLRSFHSTSYKAMIESIKNLLAADYTSRLTLINSETLLVYGGREWMFNKPYEDEIKNSIKKCQLVVYPDGTHFIIMQKYQEIAKEVFKFFPFN